LAAASVRAEAAEGGAGVATVVVPPAEVVLPYLLISAQGTDRQVANRQLCIATAWDVAEPYTLQASPQAMSLGASYD